MLTTTTRGNHNTLENWKLETEANIKKQLDFLERTEQRKSINDQERSFLQINNEKTGHLESIL